MPLRICVAAAELTPLAKAGGLGDVTAALLKYLHAEGHDIRMFLPAYADLVHQGLSIRPVDVLQNLSLQLGAHHYRFSVSTARLPGSDAFVYLIDCPACFDRPGIYTTDPDEYRRFLVLTHAAFLCCQHMAFAPQILHLHDWHTAVGAALLRSSYAWDRLFHGTRSVLTIHNVGYQGIIGAAALREVLPVGPTTMLDQGELAAGRIGLLRTGIQHADLITTVSPTYAREIQGPDYGMGLEALLHARADALIGVLNGVDYDEWDPRHDRHLPRHYGPEQLPVKAELKRRLLRRLGLTDAHQGCEPAVAAAAGTRRVPLIGIVSRLVEQKGLDLLFEALPPLLAQRPFHLAVLGSGERGYEEQFARLALRYSARVHFHRGYSDELAHWIEAASDLFLMPSHYEPCGLNQLYSLRYGSVPVVRRTGGLADSVLDFDAASGTGTGIVFDAYSATALAAAIERALDLYRRPELWRRLVRQGMAQDFSWSRQAHRYVELYEALLAR